MYIRREDARMERQSSMTSTRKCHYGPFSHPSSPVFSVAIGVPMRRCVRHTARHLESSCVDSNQGHVYFRVSVKSGWGIFGPSITDQRRGHRNLVDRSLRKNYDLFPGERKGRTPTENKSWILGSGRQLILATTTRLIVLLNTD